jgi:hypothetical protein
MNSDPTAVNNMKQKRDIAPATVDFIKPPTLSQVLGVIVPAGSFQGKRKHSVLLASCSVTLRS